MRNWKAPNGGHCSAECTRSTRAVKFKCRVSFFLISILLLRSEIPIPPQRIVDAPNIFSRTVHGCLGFANLISASASTALVIPSRVYYLKNKIKLLKYVFFPFKIERFFSYKSRATLNST